MIIDELYSDRKERSGKENCRVSIDQLSERGKYWKSSEEVWGAVIVHGPVFDSNRTTGNLIVPTTASSVTT